MFQYQLPQSSRFLSDSYKSKRSDVCNDFFGDGWLTSICAPGRTLCCVNERQSYPQCQQHMGLGWCCIESDEGNGCYVDLQSSSCGQPGAVQCSQLSAGVEEACCPQFTTCAEGYNATTTAARCNIKEIALQAMASSAPPTIESATKTEKSSSEADFISTLSSATTMGASSLQSVYSTVETPSEASTLATPDGGYPVAADSTTPSSSNGMAGGTIAGVTVGAFAVVVLLALAVWYVRRIIGRARLRNASSDRYDAQLGSQKEPQIPHTEPGPLGTTAIARDLGDNRHHDLWAGDSLKGTQTREVAELESGTG